MKPKNQAPLHNEAPRSAAGGQAVFQGCAAVWGTTFTLLTAILRFRRSGGLLIRNNLITSGYAALPATSSSRVVVEEAVVEGAAERSPSWLEEGVVEEEHNPSSPVEGVEACSRHRSDFSCRFLNRLICPISQSTSILDVGERKPRQQYDPSDTAQTGNNIQQSGQNREASANSSVAHRSLVYLRYRLAKCPLAEEHGRQN
jgi:hypothetical protein